LQRAYFVGLKAYNEIKKLNKEISCMELIFGEVTNFTYLRSLAGIKRDGAEDKYMASLFRRYSSSLLPEKKNIIIIYTQQAFLARP